jgi:translocation and assembly module TamA
MGDLNALRQADLFNHHMGGSGDAGGAVIQRAGLGLRYATVVGPLRVDVALPWRQRAGDAPWALYVGLGQAF